MDIRSSIWHSEYDLYNKIIPDYQKHSAVLTAVIAHGIAYLDHLLSRDGYYITESKEEKNKMSCTYFNPSSRPKILVTKRSPKFSSAINLRMRSKVSAVHPAFSAAFMV